MSNEPEGSSIPAKWLDWIFRYNGRRDRADDDYFDQSTFAPSGVELMLNDGSTMQMRYAFYASAYGEIAVFTQHNGCYIFDKEEIRSISGSMKNAPRC